MADASDSKSDVGDYVWVQVPSPALVQKPSCKYRKAFLLFSGKVLRTFPENSQTPGGTMLRRKEKMLHRQPAAGGESCKAGFYFTLTVGRAMRLI